MIEVQIKRILLSLVCLLATVACSDGKVEEVVEASEDPTTVLPENFFYSSVDRGQSGFCYTQLVAGGLGYLGLGENSVEPWTLGELNLILNTDLTYQARYREFTGSDLVFSNVFNDNYSVKDGTITFNNLGTATVGTYNNEGVRSVLNMTFSRDFNLVPLNGLTYHFDQICSSLQSF